jgi:hypothetical protein
MFMNSAANDEPSFTRTKMPPVEHVSALLVLRRRERHYLNPQSDRLADELPAVLAELLHGDPRGGRQGLERLGDVALAGVPHRLEHVLSDARLGGERPDVLHLLRGDLRVGECDEHDEPEQAPDVLLLNELRHVQLGALGLPHGLHRELPWHAEEFRDGDEQFLLLLGELPVAAADDGEVAEELGDLLLALRLVGHDGRSKLRNCPM